MTEAINGKTTEKSDTPATKQPTQDRGGRSRTTALIKLGLLAAAVIGLFVASRFLPIMDWVEQLRNTIEALGIWGPVLLAAVYVMATVLMLPGSPLTILAGAVFGLVTGFIAVSIGSVAGAILAFLVGRTIARGFVEQKAAENPRFGAIDRAVGRNGLKIVLLTRLSPVFPFNLLNYLFSITRVRLSHYALGSWIGMIPGTLMYVYLGFAVGEVAEVAAEGTSEGEIFKYILYGIGLVATVVVTIYVTKLARGALQEEVPGDALEETEKE